MPIGFLVAAPGSRVSKLGKSARRHGLCPGAWRCQFRGEEDHRLSRPMSLVFAPAARPSATTEHTTSGVWSRSRWSALAMTSILDVTSAFEMIRTTGSCPVFPLVKRVDERGLDQAHDHPAFVEDMARDPRGLLFRGLAHEVTVRNFESIHSHDTRSRGLAWAPAQSLVFAAWRASPPCHVPSAATSRCARDAGWQVLCPS